MNKAGARDPLVCGCGCMQEARLQIMQVTQLPCISVQSLVRLRQGMLAQQAAATTAAGASVLSNTLACIAARLLADACQPLFVVDLLVVECALLWYAVVRAFGCRTLCQLVGLRLPCQTPSACTWQWTREHCRRQQQSVTSSSRGRLQ